MQMSTLLLLCVEAAELPPSSGEITDALGIAGVDVDNTSANAVIKRLHNDGLIQLVGYRQRYGTYRSRAYGLTADGRRELNARREVLLTVLEDMPPINDPVATSGV